MGFKIDMHNHSVYSGDSIAEPRELIERAIEIGLDGIAFTEHHSFSASETVEGLKEHYRGRILVFRGAEYSAAEGHLLLFGIKDDRFNDFGLFAPVSEIIRFVREEGGVVVVPHPFRSWLQLRADMKDYPGVSAIEAFNGHTSPEDNERALNAAGELGLPTTGGSDAHSREEVGSCFTEFFDPVSCDNFIGLLRAGNYRGCAKADR